MNTSTLHNSPFVYDTAKKHFKGNFPEALPIEQAHVHIGMYLGWMIEHNMVSEYFEDESRIIILRFLRREISCTVLSELWDGHLGNELFSETGNMFTYYYYGGGIFRKDYQILLMDPGMPSIYHVKDSFENYEKLSRRITERYYEWRTIIS